MSFVSHRENAFILIVRFVIRQVCFCEINLYVAVHSMIFKISITSSSLAVQFEFKSWLKKPLHDDIMDTYYRKFTFNCLLKYINGLELRF